LILLFVPYSLISFKFLYFIFLERPRSPWEVRAEPLGLHGAQVGNFWSIRFIVSEWLGPCRLGQMYKKYY